MYTPASHDQDRDNLAGDWQKVGEFFFAALGEVATDLGGQDFATTITERASRPDTTWPDPTALKALDDAYPGSAEQVMARTEAIQKETHARELAALDTPSLRRYGQAILQGFASLNLFGTPPRRR
jgi:hypothetical protein